MKKKIGTSKSMKKMGMGGMNDGPAPKANTKDLPSSNSSSMMGDVPRIAKTVKKTNRYEKGGSIGTSKKTKMAKGGSFGMLSVKAGMDKNPKPTAADRIAGAKMKKSGMGKKTSKKK